MRSDLHDRAGATAKKGRNASGVARPSRRYRKIAPKCVRTCTTGQALPQKRAEMRQDLHVRAGATAKSPRNASGLARPSRRYRKIAPECVRTCTTEQPLPQTLPGMRQDLHDRAAATAKPARNASGLARPGRRYRKKGPKCVRTCTGGPDQAQKLTAACPGSRKSAARACGGPRSPGRRHRRRACCC